MRARGPLHHVVWLRQLANELEAAGQPVSRLLFEVGIQPRHFLTEDARLPFDQIADFFERASKAMEDDCLGLKFGQSRDIRDAGLLGYVGLSSPTVLDALRNLQRYRRVFSDAVIIEADDLESKGTLGWDFAVAETVCKQQFIEFAIANLLFQLRKLSGSQIVPRAVNFRHPRKSNVASFDRFFGCRVDFDSTVNQLQFDLADLRLPFDTADDRLLAILKSYCRMVLDRHQTEPPTLIEQIERLIIDRLTLDKARLDVVASELGMSSRTLARRLAELDTSFSAIVQDLREELALAYLSDQRLNLTQIAHFLGYTEVSSFNNAFKQWTGKTPGQMRRLPQ